MNPLSKFLKGPVVEETTGPDSYDATNGFTVTVGRLRNVEHAVVYMSGGYIGEVADVSGNTVTVKAYASGGTAVADGTDLSSVTVKVFAWGI